MTSMHLCRGNVNIHFPLYLFLLTVTVAKSLFGKSCLLAVFLCLTFNIPNDAPNNVTLIVCQAVRIGKRLIPFSVTLGLTSGVYPGVTAVSFAFFPSSAYHDV